MKRIAVVFIIIFCCMSSIAAQAQVDVTGNRSFLGFSAGIAVPGDEYGNYELRTKEDFVHGHVGTGATFTVEGAGFFIPYLGLGGKVGIFANQLDAESLADDYFALYYGDNHQNYSANADDGIAYSLYGMVGPYVTIPVARFSFDANYLIGYSYNSQPQKHVRAYDDEGKQVSFQKYDKKSEGAMITNIGLGVRFFASEDVAIKLGLDFLSTKPEFSNDVEGDFDLLIEGNEENQTIDTEADIRVTTLTLGLMFTL